MATPTNRPTADEVIGMLKDGNARFCSNQLEHPNLSQESREALVNIQEPVATILCCADSRVPPVSIFDLGLGDLFVVRVAGNIINDHILGSIEYASAHLQSPLIIVMSHSNCGAIGAVVNEAKLDGHMSTLVAPIQAAMKNVEYQIGNLTDNTAKEVAHLMADRIRESEPIIADLVEDGKVKVVPAYYDLESGEVEFLEVRK